MPEHKPHSSHTWPALRPKFGSFEELVSAGSHWMQSTPHLPSLDPPALYVLQSPKPPTCQRLASPWHGAIGPLGLG